MKSLRFIIPAFPGSHFLNRVTKAILNDLMPALILIVVLSTSYIENFFTLILGYSSFILTLGDPFWEAC